jgi:hypothetical protein
MNTCINEGMNDSSLPGAGVASVETRAGKRAVSKSLYVKIGWVPWLTLVLQSPGTATG